MVKWGYRIVAILFFAGAIFWLSQGRVIFCIAYVIFTALLLLSGGLKDGK